MFSVYFKRVEIVFTFPAQISKFVVADITRYLAVIIATWTSIALTLGIIILKFGFSYF